VQEKDTVRLNDNSDWWFQYRSSDLEERKTQERELASSTFHVLSINLDEKIEESLLLPEQRRNFLFERSPV